MEKGVTLVWHESVWLLKSFLPWVTRAAHPALGKPQPAGDTPRPLNQEMGLPAR